MGENTEVSGPRKAARHIVIIEINECDFQLSKKRPKKHHALGI